MLGALIDLREYARLIVAMTNAIADAVRGWQPPPELRGPRAALAIAMTGAMVVVEQRGDPIRGLLGFASSPGGGDPRPAGLVSVLLEYEPADPAAFASGLERFAKSPDRHVALPARQWLAHARENVGDPAGAVDATTAALALVGDDTPWARRCSARASPTSRRTWATPRRPRSTLRSALPVMERLGRWTMSSGAARAGALRDRRGAARRRRGGARVLERDR